jgi:hypothetical protein
MVGESPAREIPSFTGENLSRARETLSISAGRRRSRGARKQKRGGRVGRKLRGGCGGGEGGARLRRGPPHTPLLPPPAGRPARSLGEWQEREGNARAGAARGKKTGMHAGANSGKKWRMQCMGGVRAGLC